MAEAEALRTILLQVVRIHEAEPGGRDHHGQRYHLDVMVTWQEQQAMLRSVWNIRPDEDIPRLVTCYPLKEGTA